MSYSKYLFESLSQVVDENDSFDSNEFVISESLNSALEKVKASLAKQTKDSKHHDADKLKPTAEQPIKKIKLAVRNCMKEFAKIGIDLNKLEYSRIKSPDHVYKLLEQNNIVLVTRNAQGMHLAGDWSNLAVYTCIPLLENGKLANVAMYEIAYGYNYDRKNGHSPANSFTKLTGKKQISIQVISANSFKSAYASLLKSESWFRDVDVDTYEILFAPVDEEVSKESLAKLKFRKANERAFKQMQETSPKQVRDQE